ncbi:hypothetical protein [Saccharopolyspora griseoalba]|uniref:Uncharacterized protein n=1 Tax=Saccharopolyspora griseoalba TaxID=1431848 RepID=A0ABW2LQR7_9PSEU
MNVPNITSMHPVWQPGDVVFDAAGNLRVRSDDPRWPWAYPPEGPTRDASGGAYVPEGALEDNEVPRPLVLLVRGGQVVTESIVEE